jgi:hypothetical protein
LIVAIVCSSLLQARLGLGLWRGIHFLAYLTFALGVAHGLGSGTDKGRRWAQGWYALTVAIFTGLCVNRGIRGTKPRRRTGRSALVRRIDSRANAFGALAAPTEARPQRVGDGEEHRAARSGTR